MIIGAVLIPGAMTPRLVTREMITTMPPSSVVVDISIDQGGCFESSSPTSHQDPVFVVEGVIHYCVANIPGVVPRTSTFALTNPTLPYVLEIANRGIDAAIKNNKALARGVNTYKGIITHPGVAESMDSSFENVTKLAA